MNVIAFIIGIILLLGVGIPVSQEVIANTNLTGISATVVSFVPVFMMLSESFAQDSWQSELSSQLQGQEDCRIDWTPGPGFGPLCPIGTT
jgi:hypothetical protein